MPLSFLYYHITEQWRLVQEKMVAVEKKLSWLPPYQSRYQTGKKYRPITLAKGYLGNNPHEIDSTGCITFRF